MLSQGLSPDLQSMEQIRRILRPTDVPDAGKEIHLFSIGELAFKDGLPMEDIISANRSCPMADYKKKSQKHLF